MGADKLSTSNIIEETVSMHTIIILNKGRIFEEVDKGTAYTLTSEKYLTLTENQVFAAQGVLVKCDLAALPQSIKPNDR